MSTQERSLSRLRTRWSAVGAAVAITLGAGGVGLAQAAIDSGDKPVTVTVDARRILDTRTNLGLAGAFAKDTPREIQVTGPVDVATDTGTANETVVPAGATAVLVNVTVAFPTDQGFLTLRAGGAAGAPNTSTVNFQAGSVEPNAATVDLSADGKIQVWVFMPSAAARADVLIDVVGYTFDHNHDDRYYTEGEVDTALGAKADSADVYTKAETDAAVAPKANSADVYTKAEVDAAVAPKANSADVYTKAEVDELTNVMFATIFSDGTLLSGTDSPGLVSAVRTSEGQYTLTFERSVASCGVAATDLQWAGTRDVSASAWNGAANEVLVEVTDSSDTLEDTVFSVVVHCLPLSAGPTVANAEKDPSHTVNE